MTTPSGVRGSILLLERPEQESGGRGRQLVALLPDPDGPEPQFLLENYTGRYVARLARRAGSASADAVAQRNGPPLRLLAEDFRPAERAQESARAAGWRELAPETGPPLRLEADLASAAWAKPAHKHKLLAGTAELVVALLVMTQVEFTAPRFESDSPRDFPQVALIAPTPDEIRELTGQEPDPDGLDTLFTGEQQDLTRDIYTPEPPAIEPGTPAPAALVPEREPEPEEPAQPDPPEQLAADEAPEEESKEPEPDAFSPLPEAPERPVQVAKSPSPGETRQGREFARRRDPRQLPPPRNARRRTNPQITLEDPPATMPGERGPIELGSLRIPDRPDQRLRQNIEQVRRQGGGRQAVGDTFGTGGMGGYLPPSKGNTASDIELLTDPNGVDFRPYLIQILNTVRRNWYAVIPESARLGMNRGRVQIQFIVAKDGSVPKLVIATSAGAQSLDRAAVAGISASNPFPPLPREFAGKEVRLQFTFLYNIKRR